MIQVVVTLRAGSGGLQALRNYETKALALLPKHGGRLLAAVRPEPGQGSTTANEIHWLEFPSAEALEAFQQDSRLRALRAEREVAIAHSSMWVGQSVATSYIEGEHEPV